jgi:hypothetical protein
LVAFLQNKEITEGPLQNCFPILGILFVDFFNFYNSFELMKLEVRPRMPNDYMTPMVIFPKEMLESFIQIRGKLD